MISYYISYCCESFWEFFKLSLSSSLVLYKLIDVFTARCIRNKWTRKVLIVEGILMLICILKVSSWSRLGHLTTHLTDTYILVALLNPFVSEFQNNLIMSTRNGNASINEISNKTSPEMKEYTLCTCNNSGFNSVFDVYSQGTGSIQKGDFR